MSVSHLQVLLEHRGTAISLMRALTAICRWPTSAENLCGNRLTPLNLFLLGLNCHGHDFVPPLRILIASVLQARVSAAPIGPRRLVKQVVNTLVAKLDQKVPFDFETLPPGP